MASSHATLDSATRWPRPGDGLPTRHRRSFPEAEDGIRRCEHASWLGDLAANDGALRQVRLRVSAVHSDSSTGAQPTQGGLGSNAANRDMPTAVRGRQYPCCQDQEFAMDVAPAALCSRSTSRCPNSCSAAEYCIGRRVGEHAFDAAVMVEEGSGSVLLRNVVYAFSELQAMRGARFRGSCLPMPMPSCLPTSFWRRSTPRCAKNLHSRRRRCAGARRQGLSDVGGACSLRPSRSWMSPGRWGSACAPCR